MPPKAKITKDMIIDAAFEIARETGAENINARTVSKKLNCSTQPVMYHFATIALFAHGYASIIANNSLEYDETVVANHLERAYQGAVSASQEEGK